MTGLRSALDIFLDLSVKVFLDTMDHEDSVLMNGSIH